MEAQKAGPGLLRGQGTGGEPAGRSPRGERWEVLGVCSRQPHRAY